MSCFRKSQKMVLTEGTSDCHVIAALCKKHKLPDGFTIYDCGSDDQVIKFLNASIAGATPPEILGVVIDADNPSLQGKWNKLKKVLEGHGYNVPDAPANGGTILEKEGCTKVGVWLMPDNTVDGMLEHFCAKMASPESIDYAKNCALKAREDGIGNFIDNHIPKAIIHTFLSWQNSPGMPLGAAITAKTFNHNIEIANSFVLFLKTLFKI